MTTMYVDVLLSDCEVRYKCISRGRPESGPTYSCAGEPAEPPEFEVIVRAISDSGTLQDITHLIPELEMESILEQVQEHWEEYNS